MAIGWKYSSTPSSGSLAGPGSYVGINTDGVFVLTSSGGGEWDGTTTNAISGSSTLTIEGESILKGALNVTGAFVQAGGTSQGAITANGVLSANGGISVGGASAISASGPMTIEGESILKGALKVTGSVVAIGGVSVGAAPAIGILPNGSISGSGETYAFNFRTSGDLNASGSIYADDISGSGNIYATEITGGGINRHFINELTMSRPSVATIALHAGQCTDSTNRAYIDLTASVTIDITDSGINGLDTGAEASNTWYAVYVVSGASGMGGLLSTNETSPTMPAGYTYKRRVGWTYNHSDGDLQNFVQGGYGRERQYYWNESASDYTNVVTDVASSYPTRTAVDCSALIPPSAHGYTIRFYPGSNSDQYRDSTYVAPLAVSGSTVGWVIMRGYIATSANGGAGVIAGNVDWPIHRGDGQLRGFDVTTTYNGDLTADIIGWKETI